MKENLNEVMNKEEYEELVKYLTNFARTKLTDEEDINDVVQETLLKVCSKWKTIRNPKYAKTWATKILINECNDMYEAKSKKTDLIQKLQSIAENEEDNYDEINIDFSKSELFKNLNKYERMVVTLFYINRYKIQEISNILNMKENTVKSHLYRARKKLYQENKQKLNSQLTRALVAIIALGILGSGVTFAKNIINEMKAKMLMFPMNSVRMIDDAIENNFVLNTNTETVINNGVGIKIDNIIMDDKILNIGYSIDYPNVEINKIQLEKYTIKDEKNNILCTDINTDLNDKNIKSISNGAVTKYLEPVKQENLTWKSSATFVAYNDELYPQTNKLNILIKEISISTTDGKRMKFVGEWDFEIDLQNKFNNRTSEYYTYESNEKIKNITGKLNDLSLELEIQFNDTINETVVSKNNVILQDENGDVIEYISRTINPATNTVKFVYSIGKYSRNIDILNLYMKYDYLTENKVEVVLKK